MRGRGLKLGIIGAGVMGRNHAKIAANLPGVNLVGITDVDQAKATELASQLKVESFPDHAALLAEVEAVALVTPVQTHFTLAVDVLNAGRHLLIEKPFTGSSTTARQLTEIAREKGVVLAVGMTERFNPAFQKMLKEIRGEKIIGIDIKRLSPFPERITDANVIYDMMFHDLDLLGQLLPDEIVDVRAKGEKLRTKAFDRVVATLTHSRGSISRIEASRVFGSKVRNITVSTERFVFVSDLLHKTFYARDFSSPTPSTSPVKQADQLTEEYKDFLLAVRGKRPPTITGDDAVKALILAEEVTKKC